MRSRRGLPNHGKGVASCAGLVFIDVVLSVKRAWPAVKPLCARCYRISGTSCTASRKRRKKSRRGMSSAP